MSGKKNIVASNLSTPYSNTVTLDLSALSLSIVSTNVCTSAVVSNTINLLNAGKISPTTTNSTAYLLGGSSTTGAVSIYSNASCYMSAGYLYSNNVKVDMGELYKLNPTTNTGVRYLTGVSNTTGT